MIARPFTLDGRGGRTLLRRLLANAAQAGRKRHGGWSRPHVVMTTVTPYPNDERVRQEAETLVRAGYRVSVVCSALSGEPMRERVNGIEVYRFRPILLSYQTRQKRDRASSAVSHATDSEASRRRKEVLRYLFGWGGSTLVVLGACARILAREGIDVVHAHNPPDTLALAALPWKLAGVRFVYDEHDLAPEMYLARGGGRGSRSLIFRALLLLERLSYRLADHVITTNESYRHMAVTRGNIAPGQITIVRNGPLLEEFPEPAGTSSDNGRGIVLGYVGIIGYQDGVDELVRAVHELVFNLERRDVSCVVIGSGDAVDGLRRLARELAVDDRITFTGWLPHAAAMRVLAEVDVAVEPAPANPYTEQSTMLKIMEYMALGKPVVGFDLRENRVTADGAALFVRACNNPAELARAIAQLADDPELRARMGALGRKRVEEELAWMYSEPQLLEAYAEVLGRRPHDVRVVEPRA
jgi:glycosyltransferase involved in cell wall biosynthesis